MRRPKKGTSGAFYFTRYLWEENNMLLIRQQLRLGPGKKVQVSLPPYMEQGCSDFKLVVVNKRKSRNKVVYFSRYGRRRDRK